MVPLRIAVFFSLHFANWIIAVAAEQPTNASVSQAFVNDSTDVSPIHADPDLEGAEHRDKRQGASALLLLWEHRRGASACLGVGPTSPVRSGVNPRQLGDLKDVSSSLVNLMPLHVFPKDHIGIISTVTALMLVAVAFASVCHMMPGGGYQSHRLPPRWEPGLETSLPFRTWLQDLLLWTITSDMEPHRQAAAIISQLGGAARELARTLTPQEIFQGGIVNGQQLDPVSFLIHGLSVRFSPLDDEIRIRAAQDLLHFQRRGNEPVDVLVTRFETIRSRARAEGGGANLSVESSALVLLRAVGVNAEQFQRLTQPFGLRLPSTEQEFSDMVHQLRRMGHIIEHHPASITASLRAGGQASQSSHSYVSEPVHDPTNAMSHASSWSFVGYPDSGWGSQSSMPMPVGGQMPMNPNAEDWAYFRADGEASDTDSATESDDGYDQVPTDDLVGLSNQEADEHLYWQYSEAKKRWRRFTGKPVRALRRVLRRKGKGKGKPSHSYLDINHTLMQSSYFRNKGKGGKSSGKGFGRKQNPRGRDGEIMKCSICGSINHFRAKCPQNGYQARGSVQPASASGPQSSQLPFPPSNRHSGPNIAGFATEEEVTASDGQVGSASASLHFATSMPTEESEYVETPRPSAHNAEVHRMTPEDPWMQWHADPWSQNVGQPRPPQVPTATVLTGVWPPNPIGAFPGSSAQPSELPDEVRRTLLPQSETNLYTRMFGTVASFSTPDEQTVENTQPQDFHSMLFGDPVFSFGVPPRPTQPSVSTSAAQPPDATAMSSVFSQVQQLRRGTTGQQQQQPQSDIREEPRDQAESPLRYFGDNTSCSICQVEFQHNEEVVRLHCRHVFHNQCYDEYIARVDQAAFCPNCRGSPEVVAVWRFVASNPTENNPGDEDRESAVHQEEAQPEPEGNVTPPSTSRASTTFHTPVSSAQQSFPWWPVPSVPQTSSFHISTHRTEAGQLGILIDPGSYGNLCGEDWCVSAAKEAQDAGYRATQKNKTQPLDVGGVGSGTQRCHSEFVVPTAFRAADGSVSAGTYSAPVIPKSACPALLGLKSLIKHRTVLDLVNKRMILMPEGANLDIPAGAEVLPLEQASSGHLLLPITEYDRLRQNELDGYPVRVKHVMFADPAARDASTAPTPEVQPSQPKANPIRGNPGPKARAKAAGHVASHPTSKADMWVTVGTEVIRVHQKPRTSLFKPSDEPDCPCAQSCLASTRTTEVCFPNGEKQVLSDHWTGSSAAITFEIPWTGQTRFTILQSGAEPSQVCSEEQPEVWQVVDSQ